MKKKFKLTVNQALLIIIALIVIYCVGRLLIWNIGEDFVPDTETDPSIYDTEVLDSVFYVEPQYLEGRTDDGINTVLCLGNSFLSHVEDNDSVLSLLGEKTEANFIDCTVPGSTLSAVNSTYFVEEPNDSFTLYYLLESLCSGDFSHQDETKDTQWVATKDEMETLMTTLKSVDMEQIDTVLIMYSGYDYFNNKVLVDPNDAYHIATYTGALQSSIELLQAKYPHIRIMISSLYCSYLDDENGNRMLGTIKNFGNGTMSDYFFVECNVSNKYCLTFIDHYFGSITETNYEKYLKDSFTLNHDGIKLVADRMAPFFIPKKTN